MPAIINFISTILKKVSSPPSVTCEHSEHSQKPPGVNECSSHLHAVFDLPSVVLDDEGRLHDGRKLDVAVSLMLSLELVQQRLVGGLREAAMEKGRKSNKQTNNNKITAHTSCSTEYRD